MYKRKKRYLPVILICLCGLTGAAAAHAAEQKDRSAVQSLEEVVVTATRSEKAADAVSADVEILTKKDIETSPDGNIDALLTRFSGIDITRPSDMSVPNHMRIAIRGVDGANRVLYMVDGVPLNSALTGFIIPSIVQPESVERVEVVKGAFSSLYGSNAMGGVINIITRKPKEDGWSARPFMAAGNRGYRESGVHAEAKQDRLTCNLDMSYRRIRNHYRNDNRVDYSYNFIKGVWSREKTDTVNAGFREGRVSGRIDYAISPVTGLNFSGGYSDNYSGIGETTHLDPARDRTTKRQLYYLHAGGHTLVFDDVRLDARVYTNYDNTEMDDENRRWGEGPLGMRAAYEYGGRKFWGRDTGLQVQAVMPAGSSTSLTAGADINYKQGYWRNWGRRGKLIDDTMDKTMTAQAAYLQSETELFQRLILTLGGRFDANNTSESSFSPKLGALYRLHDRVSLRGSAGRAFRAPNLSELHMPTWQMVPGIPFMSNPGLDPEVIWSYDLGVSIKLFDRTTFELTGFYNEADDLISAVMSRGVMRLENLSKVETDGFEVSLETAPLSWLSGYANYTYTHAVDRDLGRMGNIPLHRINAGVQAVTRLSPQAVLTSSLDMRFTDTMFYQDRMTKNLLRLDAFTVFDLTLRLELYERLGIKAVMTNITNEQYEQHNADAGPERAWWLKVEYSL